jgi:hypothetical protein
MLEILQFYVSGFWVWLGLTVGLYAIVMAAALCVSSVLSAMVGRK